MKSKRYSLTTPPSIELSALMLRSIRLHNYVKCLWFNFDSPELLLSFKVSKTTIYQILCFLTKILNSSTQPQKVFFLFKISLKFEQFYLLTNLTPEERFIIPSGEIFEELIKLLPFLKKETCNKRLSYNSFLSAPSSMFANHRK